MNTVRARLTLVLAVLSAGAFSLVAIVAPNAVRGVLDDDLLAARARNSTLVFTLADSATFDPDDLSRVADGDPFPIDPDVLLDVGNIIDDFFADIRLGGVDAEQSAAEQIQLLRGLDRFDLLVDAAGGSFAIEVGPATGAIVERDGSFEIADDLRDAVTDGLPVISSNDIDQLLFDDLGIREVGGDSFVGVDSDNRTIAAVVDVDGIPVLVVADAGAVDRSVDRVRLGLWLAVPLLTLIVAAITWLLTGRALRPVRSITERAATITGGSLDARVPVPDSGDEISRLALTVNEMLDRLENDDRARRRFISDASHELRSPVAVMRNDAEVALSHPDTADARRLATVVAGESARLSTIIDDLLALARRDEGVAPPASEVDLDDIVLVEAARTRRIPIETGRVSAGRVRGRRDELSRLVNHLLDNAARHARSKVVVALQTSPSAGVRSVDLTVDDDGPGIDDADRQRIFERFVRLDEARTRDEGGTGLGLAVVRSIAERTGGSVRVDRSPAGGARFVVSFPADGFDPPDPASRRTGIS